MTAVSTTTNIRIIDETNISNVVLATYSEVVTYHANLVASAHMLPAVTVTYGGSARPGEWIVYLTERKRITGATGSHTVENGLPVAYCSPKASARPYGTFTKGLVLRGKTITTDRYTEGLITTICHELAEMLVDPYVTTSKRFSGPDPKGNKWWMEVCDPVHGSYKNYVYKGLNCILPDVVTPAFYDLKGGVAPFSIFGGAPAPFTRTPKGYGFYLNPAGRLLPL